MTETEIDLNSQSLTEFPSQAFSADVTKLELYANKIKKVPPAIGECKKLELLNCFNNIIGLSLPPEIGKLEELQEVNLAANKLAMLKDVHFEKWAKVSVLNLNDNNLTAIGSFAPMVALEELRLYANQLVALPTLGTHNELKIYEIHKNRITTEGAPDSYFTATPALERLSLWGNQLTALPSSLLSCSSLVGVQAHQNPLASLPAGEWPATLETLFIQETQVTALPPSLVKVAAKRINLGGLKLDAEADKLAEQLKKVVLAKGDGIFWGKDNKKCMP